MPNINPFPGGMMGTPAADALLLRHGAENAEKAAKAGQSYTPPIRASESLRLVPAIEEADLAPSVAAATYSPPPAVGPVTPPPPEYVPPEASQIQPYIEQVNATTTGDDSEYKHALNDLFKGFEGHAPRTDLVLTPAADVDGELAPHTRYDQAPSGVSRPAAVPPRAPIETVLVPAGRGIYAHTVLSVNSDTGGPIVLEADTGPLAGDRLIGNFSKNERDRLIVRVTTVVHRGQAIDVRGLVVAPDTMETAVASSVDEHYLERFALPAAAAFVQGLGQAIALSNSTTQITPYGGAITSYGPLNFQKQAGIAAGAAAAQIGQTLQQETPKGPTVILASNVGVGVMFLSNVAAQR
jgi:intracellular multiplication protein IcmE